MNTRTCAYALLIALVAAGVYGGTVGNGFIWDDEREIEGDRFDTHRLDRLCSAFVHSGQAGIYRPVKVAYLTLMYRFCGMRPEPYHAMCLLFHAAAAALVFLAGRRMVPEEAAGLGALIFAVHPVHAEVTAWASGFLYSLSAAFLLGGIMVHQRRMGRKPGNWGVPSGPGWAGPRPAVAEALLFMLSIMSAESGIALLFILPLYHWTAGADRRDLRAWASACGPAAAAALAYCALRLAVVGVGGRGMTLPGGIPGCLKVDVMAAADYARMLTTGGGLCVDRGWPLDTQLLSVRWLGSAAVSFALIATGVVLLRKSRAGAFLYWAAVLSFLPVSNIVPTSMTPIADRYAYIPSIFSSILLGFAADTGIRRLKRMRRGRPLSALAAVLLAAVILTWTTAAADRGRMWGSPTSLWADTVTKNPSSILGNYNLGLCHDNGGDFENAVLYYTRTVELQPSHSQALNNLGLLAVRAGRKDDALRNFRAAAEADPSNVAAFFNLGALLSELGRRDEGLLHLRTAAGLDPGRPVIEKKIAEIEKDRRD